MFNVNDFGEHAQNGADPGNAERPWPAPPADAAYQGLAGDVVRTIAPHTEADPAAILVQFLAAAGNACGRSPGFQVEADRHHVNLYVVVVGDTSKARKGTSFGQARRLVEMADPEWKLRVHSGLSSGEGLIWAVRDSITTRKAAKTTEEKARADSDGCIEEITDAGVADKRLLAYESELASVLGRMAREGNSLSSIIRQAWDGGTLNTLVKSNPAKATDAHISILAHITEEELRRELTRTEMANGFANRFLWVCAKRSKKQPLGGALHTVNWTPLLQRLTAALEHAQRTGVLDFDAEARELWIELYEWLSEGAPGLFGAVTSRAEAQVRRLAVIYAILDLSREVRREHLQAAVAIWDYNERSCRRLFGGSLGDPTADDLLAALKRAGKQGLTRTEMSNLFVRHKSSDEISRALTLLAARQLVRSETDRSGRGRPAERWYAVSSPNSPNSHSGPSEEEPRNGTQPHTNYCERSEKNNRERAVDEYPYSERSERSEVSPDDGSNYDAIYERLATKWGDA
ncbi:MAG: YfjI family protein [Actinomycetota bacterium]|nr:YfjI family protein [Actinomycetota bacterium]